MPFGLVKGLVLWRDVREEERILVGLFGFGERSPYEVSPAGDVATIELVVAVDIISDLELFWRALVEAEAQAGPAELLEETAINIPRDKARHPVLLAQRN